jgi:hypothetical protein
MVKINLIPILRSFSRIFQTFTPCDDSIYDNIPISYHLSLHSFLPFLILPHLTHSQNDLKHIFEESANENNMELDDYFLNFLLLPLCLHLSSLLRQTNIFPDLNKQLYFDLQLYSSSFYTLSLKFVMFLLIQIISGLMKDKNVFIDQILKISGIYSKNNANFKTLRLIILIFLTSLVIDRSTLFNEKESYLKDIIFSILFPTELTSKDFYDHIPLILRSDSILDQIIPTIASVHYCVDDYN